MRIRILQPDKLIILHNQYIEFLPLFYLIPEDMMQQYLKHFPHPIPRSLHALLQDEIAMNSINEDFFYNMVSDSFAYIMWSYVGPKNSYMESFSGYDPLWKLAHYADLWLLIGTLTGVSTTKELILRYRKLEFGYPSYAQVNEIRTRMAKGLLSFCDFIEIQDVIIKNRCHEDFDYRQSKEKIDFYRKWYHTRSKIKVCSIEQLSEENFDYFERTVNDYACVLVSFWLSVI